MAAKFEPLGDRLVVRVLGDQESTQKLTIEPRVGGEMPQKGMVVAVGAGSIDPEGRRTPLEVKEGDEVLYSKYEGTGITVDGEDLLVLRESDILGKAYAAPAQTHAEAEVVREDEGEADSLARLKGEIQTNIEELRALAK